MFIEQYCLSLKSVILPANLIAFDSDELDLFIAWNYDYQINPILDSILTSCQSVFQLPH